MDAAFNGLGREMPTPCARWLNWIRSPQARWLRWPLGLLFIACSFLWFLPVLGLWMLPLGLLMLAEDVPWLRRPVGKATLWGVRRWRALRRRWDSRKSSKEQA